MDEIPASGISAIKNEKLRFLLDVRFLVLLHKKAAMTFYL